jgi:hypothetical protein
MALNAIKAKAQNLHNENHPTEKAIQHPDFHVAYDCVFENYANPDTLISKLAKFDFINIEYESPARESDLLKMNGFYNLRTDKIHLRYFWPSGNSDIYLYNSRLPFVLVHELKHYQDLHFHIKHQFDARQLIIADLHEEFTARIQEMLLARHIATKTGDARSAFDKLIQENGHTDKMLGKSHQPDFFYNYRKWLDKNHKNLVDTLSQPEADIIVKTVLSMFGSDLVAMYVQELPKIITQSSLQNNRDQALYHKGQLTYKKVANYQEYINDIWTFSGQNIKPLQSRSPTKINQF